MLKPMAAEINGCFIVNVSLWIVPKQHDAALKSHLDFLKENLTGFLTGVKRFTWPSQFRAGAVRGIHLR